MRILVTRPAHDAARTAKRLAALGHQAVCAPILTISATNSPLSPADYDVLIITSANGAEYLKAVANWQDKTIYAVGPRTAQAIRDQGSPTDLRIAAGDAASLCVMIADEQSSGTHMLHITGLQHKAEPDASLRKNGFCVTTWTAYEAKSVTALPAAIASALAEKQLDAALHYSRRSVEILLALLDKNALGLGDCRQAFAGLLHVCLSDDVASAFDQSQISNIIVAPQPSEESLLALLPPPLPCQTPNS